MCREQVFTLGQVSWIPEIITAMNNTKSTATVNLNYMSFRLSLNIMEYTLLRLWKSLWLCRLFTPNYLLIARMIITMKFKELLPDILTIFASLPHLNDKTSHHRIQYFIKPLNKHVPFKLYIHFKLMIYVHHFHFSLITCVYDICLNLLSGMVCVIKYVLFYALYNTFMTIYKRNAFKYINSF